MRLIAKSILFLAVLNPIPLLADGRYLVGKDPGGVYFQTEGDGSWYIDHEDLKFFKIGEAGNYSTGKDSMGTYLSAKGHKFYLDMEAKSKLVRETQAFNAAEEKRLRDLRDDESRRRQEAEGKQAVDKGDQETHQPVKVEIYVNRKEYDENNRNETYLGSGYNPYRRPMAHIRPKNSSSRGAPPSGSPPGTPSQGAGEFPWWKGSLNPRF